MGCYTVKKTVCELFAGVGGFRCGLNNINTLEDMKKVEKWDTVWFSQWEPAEKNTQYAHDCYVYHFGTCLDKNGMDTTNYNIEDVDKKTLPDFNLLVAGFPCQDYSVASSLATSKGLEGQKGILWWSIRETIEEKKPPFVLLENVDRLIKSPAKQRGRDFGIILACFRDEGYTVEWRIINAAEYGFQQRRRRTFIFAYKNSTNYHNELQQKAGYSRDSSVEDKRISIGNVLMRDGFFAETFPVYESDTKKMLIQELPKELGELSNSFQCNFQNTGIMKDGIIFTLKTMPKCDIPPVTLGDIMETKDVEEQYFIPLEKLYYTEHDITHSDETHERLPKESRQTWQYLKGAKKLPRKAANGHEYIFSEGAIPMIDRYDKPARTMLTSEGNFSRTTHIVKDKKTGRIRLLTAQETERIQGFPTDHTKNCLVNGRVEEMPLNKRRFMMGNALVVNLVKQMEVTLSEIFEKEDNAGKVMLLPANNQSDKTGARAQSHIYKKSDLIRRLNAYLNKPLGEIDNKGLFSKIRKFKSQKGIAGAIVEQCILGYSPDNKQEADLIIIDGQKEIRTELKTIGMTIKSDPSEHFTAKEPMSITAVGIYDIANQQFWTSHFWEKLEHMLIVYYYYKSDHTVPSYEYRLFPLKGYEFHEFTDSETNTLKRDWEHVQQLCTEITSKYPNPGTKEWKTAVQQEYINIHGRLRRLLSYIDLAPKFPPRFRLKKPMVSAIIAKHFGYRLEQLPEEYLEISDVDKKCHELTNLYSGQTIEQLSKQFHVPLLSKKGTPNKSIAESIIVAMFGGTSKKLNQVELFDKFGLLAKTVILSSNGGHTEDMKLFHIDFHEVTRTEVMDEDGTEREYIFEDSELYSYFIDHEFLCIVFEEPVPDSTTHTDIPLSVNKFIGFKRLIFSDSFINETVRKLWTDIRYKVIGNHLVDIIQKRKDGTTIINKNGEPSSSPNFLKSSENDVFVRGSGRDASMKYKTECVNGIQMLPQYVWLKGSSIVDELDTVPML